MSEIVIKQKDNYDWVFENKESLDEYLEDVKDEINPKILEQINEQIKQGER